MHSKDLIKELKNGSVDELMRRLERVRMDLAKLSMKKSIKRLENVSLLRGHKKEIARILTVITEKLNSKEKSA